MTYQEAKRIALNNNRRVNACNEFQKGYYFFEERSGDWFGDSGFVVVKENGRVLNWLSFIRTYHPEVTAKELDFVTGEVKGEVKYGNDEEDDEEE